MMATKVVSKRGRPRGELRRWLEKELPKLKPQAKSDSDKNVVTNHPDFGEITVVIPKNTKLIPAELTYGKTQATVGQTARNQRDELKFKHRLIVREIPQEIELGRGKNKKSAEFSVFTIEVR